ncbi:MAG: AraC family transcriptional regulator [Barnesiella sp.]|nr:AraC family transcriptional regulator [Barnesiella sp.]
MEKTFFLSDLEMLEGHSSEFSRFGSDYLFAHLVDSGIRNLQSEGPVRVSGLTILLTVGGELDMDVNLSRYEVKTNTILTVGPDSLVQLRAISDESTDAYLLIISPDFLRDINLDVNLLYSVKVAPDPMPTMGLTDEEVALIRNYLNMIHFNTLNNADPLYVRGISRNLIAATVYQLMQFVKNHQSERVKTDHQRSRRSNYVKDFMGLIHRYHRQERSVAFYAGKLFITPKYLSLLIKEATGRSAADWIDEFVILEAKNLLRFSGKNVQQIAYELNFSNQSSFGKYFKHITGMSPTEYQRS